MIIGITGKSGVGKTTYAKNIAKQNNFYVISFDEIAHKVMENTNVRKILVDTFGEKAINRKELGDLVFSNRNLYNELRDIVWGKMKDEINSILLTQKDVILDWILLPHTHYWGVCDKKILVVAEEKKRKEMVIKRDCISKEYLKKRDLAGIDYSFYKFDEIINNDYTNN